MKYNLTDDIRIAQNMRNKAYAKYCEYTVGAVLRAKSGKKYTGCNIQNHGLQSICAERVALCKAISEGEREFDYIVVIGGQKDKEAERCLPCGVCRQFLSEFVSRDFKVYTVFGETIEEYDFSELFPYGFELLK